MRMHKTPPAIGSIDINQRGKYLLNSQTVNDSQTRSSYNFTATGEMVLVPANSALDNIFAGGGTISAWINPRSVGQVFGRIVQQDAVLYVRTAFNNKLQLALVTRNDAGGSGDGTWRVGSAGEDAAGCTVPIDEWTHVLVTYNSDDNANNPIFYQNGVAQALYVQIRPTTPAQVNSGSDLYIGRDASSNYDFDGEISKVRIYNRALTATEVKDEYSGEAVPFADIGASQTEVLTDGGLETWTSNIDLTNWSQAVQGSSSINQETGSEHGGSSAVRMDIDSSNSYAYFHQTQSLVAGKTYVCTFWLKGTVAGASRAYVRVDLSSPYTNGVAEYFATTTDWVQHTHIFTAIATGNHVFNFFRNSAASESLYWDDISVRQVGCVAEYLPTSIGATQWLDTSGNGLHSTTVTATQTHPTVFGSKVGIGTASPTADVQIHGTTNAFQYITSDSDVNDSANTSLWFAHDYSGTKDWAGIIFDADNKLRIVNSGSSNGEHLVIDDSGNVGIGQDTPHTALYVGKDGTSNQLITIHSDDDTLDTHAGILFKTASTAVDSYVKGGIFFEKTASYGRGSMIFALDNAATSTNITTAGSQLTINSDGTLDQKSNYLVNSQTVNDLQTKQSYWFDNPDTAAPENNTDFITLSANAVQSEFCAWGYGSFSVEVWIKSSATGVHQEIVSASSASYPRWGFRLQSDNKIGTFADHSVPSTVYSNIVTTNTITDGKWHHLVWTVDREDLSSLVATGNKLYIDGVEASYDTQTAPINRDLSIDTKLMVGASYYLGDRPSFQGEISTVRSYTRLLSADEVKASYSGQAVPFSETGANQTELLTDGLLEIWTDATTLTNWNKIIVGTGTSLDRSTDSYSGTYSASLTAGASASYAIIWQGESFTVGKKYKISLWAKSADGGAFYLRTHQNNDTGSINSGNANESLSSSWTNYTYEFIAGSGTGADDALVIVNTVDGTATLIDDVSIVQIGAVAEYLPTSIGATQWLDTSGNGLHGAVTGATQTHPTVFGSNVVIGGGSSHPTPATYADDLIIDSNVSSGISIFAPEAVNTHLVFGDNTDSDLGGFYYNGSSSSSTGGSNSLRISTNSSVQMTIDSAGNVGIGTETPKTRLVIYDDDSGSTVGNSVVLTVAGKNVAAGDAQEIGFIGWDGAAYNPWATIGTVIRDNSGYKTVDLTFCTRNDTNNSLPTERLRINSDGTLDQKSNYMVNSQTVNDLQTKQSYSFDGGDYVTIVSSDIRSLGNLADPFTAEAWVRLEVELDGTDTNYHVMGNEDFIDYGWEVRIEGDDKNRIDFRMSNSSSTYSSVYSADNVYPNDKKWHHILVVRPSEGAAGKIFFDGVDLAVTVSGNASPIWGEGTTSGVDFSIGVQNPTATSQRWEGEISKVRLYNRALSADEVKASYSGQAVPFSETGANQTEILTGVDLNWGTAQADTGDDAADRATFATAYGWSMSSAITDISVASNVLTFTAAEGHNINGPFLTKGKRYKVSIRTGDISGTWQLSLYGAADYYTVSDALVADTTNVFEFTANNYLYGENLYIRNTAGGGTIEFDASSVTTSLVQTGCVAEYLPTSIGATTWLDTSGNALHGTVTGATQVGQNIFGGPVGIGTDSPETTLHVASDSGTYPDLMGDLVVSQNSAAGDSAAISIISGTTGSGYLQFGDSGDANKGFIAYDHGNDIMSFRTGGSGTDWQITAAGNLKPGAGLGIAFTNQTTSDTGIVSSEVLDHYEEGTWTGVISDGTNNATMNGSYTTGAYTRVGNLVTVSGYFITTSLGSVSGSIKLTGLPFASADTDTARNGISVGNATGLNITAGMSIGGYIVPNTSAISLRLWDATTGVTGLQATEWTADGEFMISGSYIV